MTKQEKIKKLLEVSGKNQRATQAFQKRISSFGFLTDEEREEIVAEYQKAVDDHADREATIYDRWLDEKTIEDHLAFYQSASGQKMMDNMPHITDELTQCSQDLIARVFKKLGEIIEKNHQFDPNLFDGLDEDKEYDG